MKQAEAKKSVLQDVWNWLTNKTSDEKNLEQIVGKQYELLRKLDIAGEKGALKIQAEYDALDAERITLEQEIANERAQEKHLSALNADTAKHIADIRTDAELAKLHKQQEVIYATAEVETAKSMADETAAKKHIEKLLTELNPGQEFDAKKLCNPMIRYKTNEYGNSHGFQLQKATDIVYSEHCKK